MNSLTASDYDRLLSLARRHSRVAHEAEDLLQEALCVATEQGRLDLEHADRSWFSGVLANLALRRARDAVRRKRREENHLRPGATEVPPLPGAAFIRTLPKSARTVAVLAINNMTPAEIKHVCGLSDGAYRQRLSTIRKAWRASDTEPGESANSPAGLDFGRLRAALLGPVKRRGHVGTHDPDGNLFLLSGKSSSQTDRPRQQPGEADA